MMSKTKELPAPRAKGDLPLEKVIAERRSVRAFASTELELWQIGQLAWAAQGITDPRRGYRAAPSAGALYPLELYLVTAEGAYHYEPRGHTIELVERGDLRSRLAAAALHQHFIEDAPLVIVIAAVYERVTRKYGDRGIRYVHMEAGHAGQNILLQAVALGLGAVPVGAFSDEAVSDVLSLPGDRKPLYIIPVGHPR